ncbi:peptidoglycan-associated lipoprotein Pal [Deltaproteobacteria bacterium TL4]
MKRARYNLCGILCFLFFIVGCSSSPQSNPSGSQNTTDAQKQAQAEALKALATKEKTPSSSPNSVSNKQSPETARTTNNVASSSRDTNRTYVDPESGKEVPLIVEAPPEETLQAETIYELQTVYFDFDRSNVKDEFKELLEKNYYWIQKNPDIRIQLEGHADERGSSEYNLALGEKRAQSILEYLISKGANPTQFDILTFGEERPVDQGHNQEAWSKNRRVEFTGL